MRNKDNLSTALVDLASAIDVDSLRLGVSYASNRRSTNWKNTTIGWDQLVRKLSTPIVTPEKQVEYQAMTHDQQSDIKDVGGFVGGIVMGGRRIRGSVQYRQVLALDLDNTTTLFDEMFYKLSDVWDFRFLLHTTRSYTTLTPRYRVIIPLSRQVDATEYEAIGRYIASRYNIDQFDPTTYQDTRLMYFPSRSVDGYFNALENRRSVVDADKVLAQYDDYTNPEGWSYGVNDSPHVTSELATVQDPLAKGGVVGAFCKAYGINELLHTKLSAYYKPERSGRYTFIGGTTSGGVVVYEDKWVYSHHSTDPNRNKLLNAFDLYRLVMYGALDRGVAKQTKSENLPSYSAMVQLCNTDKRVQQYMVSSEAYDLALFGDDTEASEGTGAEDQEGDWVADLMLKLDKHPKSGKIECTLNNYVQILENDPNLCVNLTLDVFDESISIKNKVPWERKEDAFWGDTDDASARIYINKVYGFKPHRDYYKDAFTHVMNKDARRIDSALDFVNRGTWDGVERAETIFINSLGVDDTPLNRQQTLLWLKAIVARQYRPGTKFDNMLVLSGAEGIGKSTAFRLLVGDRYFTDSFSFAWRSQQMYEAIDGKLIVESAELDGFDKKEAEAVKAFLSSVSDRYRRPYATRTTEVPRRNVFAGSTNQVEVLRSQTGNRRMWIMECNKDAIITSVWDLLTPDYVEQVWAEVREKYKKDNRLYLPPELVEVQRVQQLEFTQEDPLAQEVVQYCKIWLPSHWYSLPKSERRRYISAIQRGDLPPYQAEMRRESVSATEFIFEYMGQNVDNKTQYLTKQVNTAIRTLEGVDKNSIRNSDVAYGRLRSYLVGSEVNGGKVDMENYDNGYFNPL